MIVSLLLERFKRQFPEILAAIHDSVEAEFEASAWADVAELKRDEALTSIKTALTTLGGLDQLDSLTGGQIKPIIDTSGLDEDEVKDQLTQVAAEAVFNAVSGVMSALLANGVLADELNKVLTENVDKTIRLSQLRNAKRAEPPAPSEDKV